MRRIVLLTAVLFLGLSPSVKADTITSGKMPCGASFLCASIADPFAMVAKGNACVSMNFSMNPSASHFEESAGLDSGFCLRAKPVPKSPVGYTMQPSCCITQLQDGSGNCIMSCERIGRK